MSALLKYIIIKAIKGCVFFLLENQNQRGDRSKKRLVFMGLLGACIVFFS